MPITNLTAAAFADFTNRSTPVLLDFYATWCDPCKRMGETLKEISTARPTLPVGKIDVDAEPTLANAWVVQKLPTLVLLQNGEIAHRWTGETPADAILTAVDSASLSPTENAIETAPTNQATPPEPPLFWNGTLSPHLYNAAIPDLPDGTSPVSPEWPMW